jgi:hypothetical protein
MHFVLNERIGRISIDLNADVMERGINILVVGGDSPHIGGVVLSVPRKSLADKGLSCDSWIVPVSGHKDVLIAQQIAELVCKNAGIAVVVSAGIHVDRASSEEIHSIEVACLRLAERLCEQISGKTDA